MLALYSAVMKTLVSRKDVTAIREAFNVLEHVNCLQKAKKPKNSRLFRLADTINQRMGNCPNFPKSA